VSFAKAPWALKQGYARPEELEHTEEFGKIPGADTGFVSPRSKERRRSQIGTLGAGNHFIEVDRVAAVYDEAAADRLALFLNQVAVQIHCGSRGLGHAGRERSPPSEIRETSRRTQPAKPSGEMTRNLGSRTKPQVKHSSNKIVL
jgi:RNA-splicing ligase RtcB